MMIAQRSFLIQCTEASLYTRPLPFGLNFALKHDQCVPISKKSNCRLFLFTNINLNAKIYCKQRKVLISFLGIIHLNQKQMERGGRVEAAVVLAGSCFYKLQ